MFSFEIRERHAGMISASRFPVDFPAAPGTPEFPLKAGLTWQKADGTRTRGYPPGSVR
jgi:hypothetical protein